MSAKDELRDRSYIGEVKYRDNWYPGTHEPLIDHSTIDRVQVLLGGQTYQSHELLNAGGIIQCGTCERPLTGELKKRETKAGTGASRYYRCARYNRDDHLRVRLREEELDDQKLALFATLKVEDEKVRDWFANALRAKTRERQRSSADQIVDLQRQLTLLDGQKRRLLNLRLLEEIDEQTFAEKHTELRDEIAAVNIKIDACRRSEDEGGDVAVKTFEHSQTLLEKWVTADTRAKRQILEIVCLNFTLDGVTLAPEWRKPFDVLAEGLKSENSRGDWI